MRCITFYDNTRALNFRGNTQAIFMGGCFYGNNETTMNENNKQISKHYMQCVQFAKQDFF